MVFSSALFLTRFLPLLLLVYFLADKKYRNWILLFGSVIFYSWKAPRFIFMILGTTLADFWLVKKMHAEPGRKKKRIYLIASLVLNLGLLAYFKYSGFFIANINEIISWYGGGPIPWMEIALPIGISFYTFESMTYVIDVYRGVHAPQEKFSSYLLYIMLFPKLVAGPIVRYHQLADQLQERNETNELRLMGFIRFCTGLAKKVLIANYLGKYATVIYGTFDGKTPGFDPATLDVSTAWIAALAFAFQIYFDFSGYTDMAIGLGKMFGFRLPENFNRPYIADSVTDFWRRWHMTLGAWMKNYLYIPLGGNRVNTKRIYQNLFIVFLISGLWHGASWNFVFWGCWHGFFLIIERLFLLKIYARLFRPLRILLTFFFVVIGWVLFRVTDLELAFGYIGALFGAGNSTDPFVVPGPLIFFFAVAAFFSFFPVVPALTMLHEKWKVLWERNRVALSFAVVGSILVFWVSLGYVTTENFNPFIYFRF